MKKINSREFQKHFSELTTGLKNGQTVEITRHGKTIGKFTRIDARKNKMPDFLAELRKHTYPSEVGDLALEDFTRSLSEQ